MSTTVHEQLSTGGQWATEDDAKKALDEALSRHVDKLNVYREVPGYYTHTRPNVEIKTPRIDRLVIPKQPMIDAGWPHGAFGIEVKCSGKKTGPVIAQAIDYSHAIFRLPQGYLIALEWVFIFPLAEMHGDIASIMMQNRVGRAWLGYGDRLSFGVEGMWGINLYRDGMVDAKELKCGRRMGSR